MKKIFYLSLLFTFLFTVNCNTVNSKVKTIKAMTYNIRMATTIDKENYWDYRKDYAADLIKFHNPDIIGMQEVLYQQLTDLEKRLDEYDYIGVGREDGKTKGEYSCIFYKKERFIIIDSGTFWLSEDIHAVGVKGWDAACERVATWGIFKDKVSKSIFFMLNTHLDHKGPIARRESAKLLLQKIAELSGGKYPVIVTGDFNSTFNDEPIQIITDTTNPNHLVDSRSITQFKYGPDWSFHSFGRTPINKRNIIDYIFVKEGTEVLQHAVLSENKGDIYPSDHTPVTATIVIKN